MYIECVAKHFSMCGELIHLGIYLDMKKVHIQNFIDGQNCKVAGWGLAEGKGRKGDYYPEKLLQVSVPIRNTAKCEKDYRNLSNKQEKRWDF